MRLFTVGPVACYPQVLEAMGMQMYSHRSKEYLELHYEVVRKLQEFLGTESPVFLFSSTGSGFMEACVRNCVRERMLVCVNGSFGKRFAEVGRANGREVVVLESELGAPTLPEDLEEALEEEPEVEAVAITHNETSTGLLNDLPALTRVCRDFGVLVFVDAVSSMGGVEIRVDEWGIDVCFSSSQKCFGVPPGLGIGSVGSRALEASENMDEKGWYFDFKLWERYHERGRGTPMTSVIPQVAGLGAALGLVEEMGGPHSYYRLYKRRNQAIREGLAELGLKLFPRPGFESPTVSCVEAPPGFTGPEVYERMRGEGYELAQGYGSLRETTFRIGNMGWIPEEYIEGMLEALGRVVSTR